MNTIYNVVWNSKTGTWVVASEMAKGRKKAGRSVSGEALVLSTFVLISPALAMAATGTVILGPNATATGNNNIALGSDAKALGAGNNVAIGQMSLAGDAWNSASGSTALGGYANATGSWGSALGFESDASGIYSTALGSSALSSGESSVAIGGATRNAGAVASAKNAVAIGAGSRASVEGSVALGFNSIANRGNSVSVGSAGGERQITNVAKATADTDAVNFAQLKELAGGAGGASSKYFHVNSSDVDSEASGTNSVAIGTKAKAVGVAAIAVGENALTAGNNSIALGGNSKAGDYSVSVGNNANTSASTWAVATGLNSKVTGKYGVALGASTQVTGDNAIAIGANSIADRANSVSVGSAGSERVVTNVANGTSGTDAVNVSQLTGATNSLTAAINAVDAKTGSGGSSKYFHSNSQLADSTAVGSNSVAVGGAASAKGTSGIAIGSSAVAESDWAFAAGNAASAKKSGDVALGASSLASGGGQDAYATALGANAQATAAKSTALGAGSFATHANSVALGYNSATTADNVVSVGNSALQRKIVFVAKGTAGTDAVNVDQLKGVATAVGADLNTDGSVKKPTITVGGTSYDNVTAAINAVDAKTVNAGSSKYFHTNATLGDSVTTGAESIAIGGNAASDGKWAVALGTNSKATSDNSVALGNSSLADRANSVAVGSATIQRQIINLAKGTADTDAVNVSQLKGVTTALGGGAGVNTDGTIKAPSYTVQGQANADLGTALGKLDTATTANATAINGLISGGGTSQYVHINSTGADSAATGTESVAIGSNAKAVGAAAIALGENATTAGHNNIAIGGDSKASDKSVSIGNGADTSASSWAVATGINAKVTGAYGVALGAGTQVTGANAAAIGANSIAERANSVSVGRTGAEQRQIINVAKGTAGTDAVNVDQLKGVATAIGADLNADGSVKKPTITVGGTAYDNVGAAIDAVAKNGPGNPLGVSYDDSSKALVTLNKGGTATKISNVATGTDAGDAVNKGQLDTAIANSGVAEVASKLKFLKYGPSSSLEAQATGADSVAIGGNAFANGASSLALGLNARASANNTVAAGVGALAGAEGAVSLGSGSRVQGANSVALGSGSSVAASESWVVSVGSLTNKRRITNLADGVAASDAATVGQVGTAIDKALSTKSRSLVSPLAATVTTQAATVTTQSATSSVPVDKLIVAGPTTLGGQIEATGTDALAIGLNTHATADSAVSVGQNVNVVSKESVGVGQNVVVNGLHSVVIGSNVSAIVDDAAVFGSGAAVESAGGVAIGSYASVINTAPDSVAIGRNAQALAANTVVLGKGSTDDNRANTFSVGSTLGTSVKRQIINVAKGTVDTDAVNVSQLKGVTSAIGGGAGVNADGTVKAPSYTVQGQTGIADVGSALGKLDTATTANTAAINNLVSGGGSSKYFHANSTGADSAATGTDSVAIGSNAKAVGAAGIALGLNATTTGANNIAIGGDSKSADKAISIGNGADTSTQAWAVGLGTNAKVTGTLGTALGAAAQVTGDNAAAIGANSLADRANSVSVGKSGSERQITNVAKGTADTDAVNVSQLKAAGIVDPTGKTVDAVVYDAGSNKGTVTFGGASGTVLKNVAKGTADTDAVNVSQLKAAGIVDTGGKTVDAVVYDAGSNKGSVSFGGASGTVLKNVAKGTADTDAANLSQLKGVAAAIGGGAAVNPDGTIKAPDYVVGGTTVHTIGDAITNVDGRITNVLNGKAGLVQQSAAGANLTVGKDTDGAAVDFTNKASATRQLKGITAGVADTDGVNVKQLNDKLASLPSNPNAVSYDDSSRTQLTLNKGGAAAKVSNVAAGTAAGDAVNKGQLDSAISGITTSVSDIAPKLKYVKFGASTALDASATGADSVAIGGNAFASNSGALALGLNSRAAADKAFAAGAGALAGADSAVALGSGSRAQGANSVALGSGSSVAASESWVVSVGSLTNKRRITNLADGTAASDAATVGQVGRAIDTALSSKSRSLVSPLAATVTTQAATVTTQAAGTSSVPVDKLIVAGPTTLGGQIEASGTNALAIGLNTHASADDAVSVGQNVNVVSKEGVGVGQNVVVNGLHSVVIGSNVSAIVDDAAVFGNASAVEAAGGVAIGAAASVLSTAADSVAIGRNTQALAAGTVVLGKGSTDDSRANTVSVGSTLGTAIQRQVINVAKGTADTDAVNVSQLKGVAKAIGGDVNTDGSIKKPTITVGGTAYDNVAAAIEAASKTGGGGADPLGLTYDDSTKAQVTLNKGAGPATIANVKAGVADTDAVNVSQLKASGLVDSTGKTVDAVVYDAGSNKGSVSFGGANGTVLNNVAAGTVDATSKQAINGSQLYTANKSVADAIGGGATVGKDGTVSKPSITVGGNKYDNVEAAIGAVEAKAATGSTLGVAYDDDTKASVTLNKGGAAVTLKNVANATKDDEAVNLAQLKGAGLVADGGSVLDAVVYDAGSNKSTVTFGGLNGTVLDNVADGRIEAGSRQAVNGGQIAAIKSALEGKITNIDNRVTNVEQHGGAGNAAYVTANGIGGSPKPASAGDSAGVAVGFDSNASGQGASVIGDHAKAAGVDSVAIGNNASTTAAGANSVALGNGSVADRANTVSVGSEGNERTISNVARGSADNDAVNVGLLNERVRDLGASANAYTDKAINDVWSNLSEEIDHSNRQANRGIAAASALINVTPYVPGHVTVNAGVAGYRGESALGVGVSRWSENGRVNLNAGVSAAQGDEAIFRVGVGYIF